MVWPSLCRASTFRHAAGSGWRGSLLGEVKGERRYFRLGGQELSRVPRQPDPAPPHSVAGIEPAPSPIPTLVDPRKRGCAETSALRKEQCRRNLIALVCLLRGRTPRAILALRFELYSYLMYLNL